MTSSALAGALLLLAAASTLLGITTAEALYPEPYTTRRNEISDLGARAASGAAAHQPSAAIFNGAMLLTGASIATAGSILARRAGGVRGVGAMLVVHGIATAGVGLFPSDQRAPHLASAVVTFATGGLAALLASRTQPPPSRYASATLGTVVLAALVLTGAGPRTALYEGLGPGGFERWIAYPIVLWLAAFGGYLMGEHASPVVEEQAGQD